jgi:hypothetical protein
MLPNALDCCRRAVSGQFSELIEDAGYKLNEKRNGIYSVVGTGTHTGVHNMLTHKIKTGELNSVDENIQAGIAEYEKKLKDSSDILYDDITYNQASGKFQIMRHVKYYQHDIAPRLVFPENAKPEDCLEIATEHTLKGFRISGHIDVRPIDSIRDTKSGKIMRPYHSQLGGYANLSITDGYKKPKYLIADYLPRVHMDKPYPGTKTECYPVDFSMNEGWYVINQLIRDVNNFKEAGNPAHFQANPQSTLCNEIYCRAFKTEFCKYH